jgi:lipase ATG15
MKIFKKFPIFILNLTLKYTYASKFLDSKGDLVINYENILDLANMASNAYINPQDSNWINTNLQEIHDISLNSDSLRVYLFRNQTLKTNVIAIKGTTLYWGYSLDNTCSINNNTDNTDNVYIDSTYYNDKINDNLYFSCCYYKQSNLFEHCDDNCQDNYNNYINDYNNYINDYKCCLKCYNNSKNLDLNYLNIGSEIINNLQKTVNFNEEIIFTGHSLGGAVASLLAVKYHKVGVGFQSPGDKHYANMINMDYKNSRIYHFGHDADPIFMGDCGSTCNLLGYNIYTKCHIGKSCIYNAKDKLNIGESLWNHRINFVINNIISQWQNDMPECLTINDCNDCENWKYQ